MSYSLYFQAQVVPKDTWFLVAVLRSFEHLQFDRTYDKVTGTFEFLVPEGHLVFFKELMEYFQKEGIVLSWQEMDNRLAEKDAVV